MAPYPATRLRRLRRLPALRDWLRETQAGRVLCRQPVQEAFAYLAANGFKTYVVTSRDSAALRVLAAEVGDFVLLRADGGEPT